MYIYACVYTYLYIYTHIRCALRTPNLSMAPDSSLGDWPANGFGFLSGLRVQGFGVRGFVCRSRV